eukprot:TRINITY_DN9579_c0_g1_i1.p1 TRINITY_DN9579_c0_g1~~TRINITY_DN9579_c0_g1_i1.p1  ORF type:complete len:367 (+),score=37.80 TRINITY_DN9579_c0_g1_i1:260-1360(+)
MNLSGLAVVRAATSLGIDVPSDVLVLVDDINLPFASVRFRMHGGSGGHNGLRHVASCVGPNFARIRIGIGRPRDSVTAFVLGRFKQHEIDELQAHGGAFDNVAEHIKSWVRMAHPLPCCPTAVPPVVGADYLPSGTIARLPEVDVDLYSVGNGPHVVVSIYDIFGYHPNAFQVCDRLAAAGFRVVMPDFFRGKRLPLQPWPPIEGLDAMRAFAQQQGKWEEAGPILAATLNNVRLTTPKEQVELLRFGTIGFCWGGKVAFRWAAEEGVDAPHALATAHPSRVDEVDANSVRCPTCVLPSEDEPPMKEVQAILETNSFAALNVWQRFDDMHHGWCGARGDWSNSDQAQRATEALNLAASFFHRVFTM